LYDGGGHDDTPICIFPLLKGEPRGWREGPLYFPGAAHNIQAMAPTEDPEVLKSRLAELSVEHRDLDEAIERLLATPPKDQLLLRRLKKRKLLLKDRMALIERMLEPDVPA
jgi:hypothetical protein